MTKREFMEKLTRELENRRVADAEDIIEEYRQHFEFKLADGYSQEEIAAKLGDPAALAAQFAESGEGKSAGAGSRILVRVGLGFVDLLEGMIFLMLLAFGLVLTAATAAFAVSGVCLAVGSGMFEPVAPMPYGAALLLGLALLALSVLTATGCTWYGVYLRQSVRMYFRFRSTAIARAEGRAVLPAASPRPRLSGAKARRLRKTARISLTAFAVLFVAALVASMLLAGAFEFWHAWGWFGYAGL